VLALLAVVEVVVGFLITSLHEVTRTDDSLLDDVRLDVPLLLSCLAQHHVGYMEEIIHIYAYLKRHE
jgi:hypothetical protein